VLLLVDSLLIVVVLWIVLCSTLLSAVGSATPVLESSFFYNFTGEN
jgi:hypothetical protein